MRYFAVHTGIHVCVLDKPDESAGYSIMCKKFLNNLSIHTVEGILVVCKVDAGWREEERDPTQSYDENPYTNSKFHSAPL